MIPPRADRSTAPEPLSGFTRRQLDVFDFICSFRLEHGTAPSYEEIAEHLGLKSTKPVVRLVRALAAGRAIVRRRGKPRSAVPVPRNAITVELPNRLEHAVRVIAQRARTTPEAVVAEAVHARLSGICESLAPPDAPPRRRR